MSSAYHPQTDGQSEVLNKTLEMYLRCFVFDHPSQWVRFLPWAELWYNTSYHESIGTTPFEAVYGRPPPVIVTDATVQDTPPDVLSLLQQRDEVLQQVKLHLQQAKARMKRHADKKRTELQFAEGDWVYVKLKPYRQMSVSLRKNQKLSLRYFGPFPILAKIGKVAYKLKLPENARIHPVFHVSFLKRCEGSPSEFYLPTFDLEDKVNVDGVGNVTGPGGDVVGSPMETGPGYEAQVETLRRGTRVRNKPKKLCE